MAKSGNDATPIVPIIRDLLRDLAVIRFRPQHLFRSDVSEPLTSILRRVHQRHAASKAARDPNYMPALIARAVTTELAKSGRLAEMAGGTLLRSFTDLACALADDNDLCPQFPALDPSRKLTLTEESALRTRLSELEFRLVNEGPIHAHFSATVASVVRLLVNEIPASALALKEQSTAIITAPIVALMRDPASCISQVLSAVLEESTTDSDAVADQCLRETRVQLYENVLAASGLTAEQARQHPNKMIVPAKSTLMPGEMAATYFSATPFLPLFSMPVPFSNPQKTRFEHTHVVGGTGHGKTQLLQTLLLADIDDPSEPSIVVIDSQGDTVRKFSELARFANSDRLIIVDPSDVHFPLALNVFDVGMERLNTLSLAEREQQLAGIIELYDYIFGTIGAELTQKQDVVFRYITRLMLDIPDANIQTLLQLMQDEKPFRPYIERLTGTARTFFDNDFSSKSFGGTKEQIRRRLYGVLSNPTFERMFSSRYNKLDMSAALNSGKIVLINTAKDFLKADASGFFGRYMISLVMQAVFERASVREEHRRPAFLYIDEAQDYFDANIDQLLIQARKYNLGVTLAHQMLSQLEPSLRASIMTNPATRFAGGVSHTDANALDADMRTSSEFLMSTRKGAKSTEFACYVKNMTSAAVKLTVPLGLVENSPRMTKLDHRRIIERSRALVAEPLARVSENKQEMAPETSTPNHIDPALPSRW